MKIGMMGMGKLGLSCALAIESRGHEVVGYDYDPRIEKYIAEGKIPYKEKDVEKYLPTTKIKVVDPYDMVGECDIIFVTVQTPHNEKFEGITRLSDERVDFNYHYLKDAIITLSRICEKKNVDQIVSVVSTVLPGTMDREILPIIRGGKDRIKLAYNPFFIAMGSCIQDFLYPEFVLLGMDDPEAMKIVENFYKLTLDWGGMKERIFKCSIKTSEAIKVLYNTYITQKIVFANAAMELCHKTGADVDDLIDCLSLGTKRITSPMYMRGGMSDGGSCHPRDNIALSAIARKHDISYDWWENLMMAREKQTEWLAGLILDKHRETTYPIVILGKAFKPETNLIVGSPSILLYNILKEVVPESHLHIYDPHVDGRIQGEGDIVIFEFPGPSVIFIGTKHEIFASTVFPAGSIVIDPWRYIPDQEGVEVIRIGQAKK
jgi:UDPglucose 6-dehydrogenase